LSMTRRHLVWLSAGAVACSRTRSAADLLPETVGDWKRRDLRELPSRDAPSPIPKDAARRVLETSYEGPGLATVMVYELRSSAGALDAAQRWKPEADTVFFYSDNLFVVVRWKQAEREQLGRLVHGLEAHMGAGPRK